MEICLRDVIKIKHGFAFKGEFFTNEETGLAVLTPGNFTLSGGFQETEKFYSSSDFPMEFVLSAGDLIVTMTDLSKEADTIGYSAIVPDNKNHKYLHNQRIGLVTVYNSDFDKDFIYWLMRSPHYQRTIANSSNGSTVHHTSPERIYRYRFIRREKNAQQQIAATLSAYDNLIEINNKRIKVLEQMAENLYKEWFVRFRFPGYETAEFENGIPKGWEIKRYREIVPIVTGKKDANYGDDGGPYPFFTCAQEPIRSPGYSFDCSAVLLAGNCDLNAKIYKGKFEAYQRTYVLSPYDENLLYLLFYLIKDNVSILKQSSTGAAISFITKGMIERIYCVIPTRELLLRFNAILSKLFMQKDNLAKQNEKLVCQRDLLLPRLMSGKLEV